MAENWGGGAPPHILGGGSVLIYHKVACAEAYVHTKWHLDASNRLTTIEMSQKIGEGLRPLWGGELGTHLAQCGLKQGPPSCQVPS